MNHTAHFTIDTKTHIIKAFKINVLRVKCFKKSICCTNFINRFSFLKLELLYILGDSKKINFNTENKRPSSFSGKQENKHVERPILEQSSPTGGDIPTNGSNSQRLNSKPKINHHFINPANADELEAQNKDALTRAVIGGKHASVSPSLSLNQIHKSGTKPPLMQSASLRNHLIDATAPAKSHLCSGFRFISLAKIKLNLIPLRIAFFVLLINSARCNIFFDYFLENVPDHF